MKNFISICCTAVIFLICFGVVYPYIGTFAEGDETSGYINNVQCIREINTGEELSSLASSDTDIAIVRVNGGGTLSLGAETAPFDAQDFGGAVPAFYVDDEASAAAAASLIAEQSPYAFVVSGSAALVRQVRERCNTAGGIVDFRGRELSALNMRNEVNENLAKSALVAAGQLNAEDVQLLKKLFVNVYTAADSEEECIRALACGADGVLCPDAELLSEALCKGAETGIYAPRPFVVSHRGSSQATRQGRAYYENTVAAARAAYDAYHPDFVEIDLYLSADGYVVISHDATLDRMTTGTGSIESMTLAQIRQYKVDGGLGESAEYLDEIAVLDDYFEEFQNDGLMFLLEIKSAKTECVDAALALIKKYGMEGRVNFISFDRAQLAYAQSAEPSISVSYLTNGSEYDTGSDSFAAEVLSEVNPLNASLSPNWESMDAAGVRVLNRYGVKVNAWTLNMEAAFFREIRGIGYASYTTDYCGWMEKHPYSIDVPGEIVVAPGESVDIEAQLQSWSGKTEEASLSVYYVSDGLTLADGKITAGEAEGRETVVLLYEGSMYSVLSAPIDVVIRAGGGESEVPAGGCAGSASGGALAFAAVLLSVAAPAAALLRKKKNR